MSNQEVAWQHINEPNISYKLNISRLKLHNDPIMTEKFDPLEEVGQEFKIAAMRRHISNIVNSYRNATDVLAEPIQNSLDELVRAHEEGVESADRIEVHINTDTNVIEVRDTGRGFELEDLRRFIAPNQTDKVQLFDEGVVRGHKGVGLTFLAYGFNDFELESITQDGHHYQLRLEGGLRWVKGRNEESPPVARVDDVVEGDGELVSRGTRVRIKADEQSQPKRLGLAFNNAAMTAMILERRTAIGVVPPSSDDHPKFSASLVYTDAHGEQTEVDLSSEYRFPHRNLPSDMETLNLGEYRAKYAEELEIDPSHRGRYDAVYEYHGPEEVAGFVGAAYGEQLQTSGEVEDYIEYHEVHAYVLFSYSTAFRDRLREHWEVPKNRRYHYPGVRIASDGMISSWRQDVSLRHGAGNQNRLWLVYHFINVEPDLGRKEFPQEVYDVIESTQETISSHTIKDGLSFLKPAPRGRAGGTEPDNEPEPAVKANERKKSPLPISHLPGFGEIELESEPNEEQDVVAVFNQLIGLDLMSGYSPVYFSENDRYDSFFEYDPDEVTSILQDVFPGESDVGGRNRQGIAEFKFDGKSLIEDIVNYQKKWEDIQFLICWKVSVEKRKLAGDAIHFSEATSPSDRKYVGVTHIANLDSAGQIPVYTIALKTLIEQVAEELSD